MKIQSVCIDLILPLASVVAVVVLAAASATAQSEPDSPPSAKLDALAQQTLDRWTQLEYRPWQSGLTGGSVELVFEGTSRGRPLHGTAKYTWDTAKAGATSELAWQPAALGTQLSQEGWSRENLDRMFLRSDDLEGFRGCSLTAASENRQVVVSVAGDAQSGLRRMTFDSKGLLVKQEFEIKQGGPEMRFSLEATHRKHDQRYVKATETFRMNMGGKIVSKATHSFAKVDGVLLPSKVEEQSTWNDHPAGSKTVTWTKWKVEQAKPASKPEK